MARQTGWQEVADQLQARKADVDAQIAHYPAPITGCDAQFNHLLEERKALQSALVRLEAVRKETGENEAAVADFLQSNPITSAELDTKQQ